MPHNWNSTHILKKYILKSAQKMIKSGKKKKKKKKKNKLYK